MNKQNLQRNDLITINYNLDESHEDPESGFIRIDNAIFTRAGVFRYLNDDGTERFELRPEQEVFSDEAMASMQNIPMFNDHPPVAVTTENASDLGPTGSSGTDVRRAGNNAIGSLIFWDGKSIFDARHGKKQLSMGYRTDVIEEAGMTPDGVPFGFIQTNIRYNHVAQVDQGRAGNARFRIDHGELVQPKTKEKERNKMELQDYIDTLCNLGGVVEVRNDAKHIKIGDEKFPLTSKDEAKAAIKAFGAWAKDQAKKNADKGSGKKDNKDSEQIAQLQAERDKAQQERDELKSKQDALTSEETKKKDKDKFDGAVKERLELEKTAEKFKVDTNDKSNSEIKIAICVEDGADKDKLSDSAYLDARFDLVAEKEIKRVDGVKKIRDPKLKLDKDNGDEDQEDADEARNDMIGNLEDRWKNSTDQARKDKQEARG